MDTTPLSQIEQVLADRQPEESSGRSRCEEIEQLIPTMGWDAVLAGLLHVLSTYRQDADYVVVAQVLWGAVLDGRNMPVDRVIALLYHRFDPGGDREDNLAWSITTKLKGINYLSTYNPLDDPSIAREIAAFRSDKL